MQFLNDDSRVWKGRQAGRSRLVLLDSSGLVATPIIIRTCSMATLEEQVAEQTRQLGELRGAFALAPSWVAVATDRFTLEVRPIMK